MPIARYNGGETTAHIDRRYFAQGEQRKENGVWVSYYYCRDHLGSIREVMHSDGTLAARYDYDPYGICHARYQSSAYGACDFGYTGHITQASPVAGQTEIVLTHYRAYDPHHARWLTPDPIGEAGGLNLYEYCLGNPMMFHDPDGMLPWGMENWDMNDWAGMVMTPDEVLDSARIGVGATIDGIVPFADPMKNTFKTYNDCDTGAKESRFLGELARDVGLAAATGGAAAARGGASRVIAGNAKSGIYQFTTTSGRRYVGQSGNIASRIGSHNRPIYSTVKQWKVYGNKSAREIAEQARIDKLGGITKLANKVNPIGNKRIHLMKGYMNADLAAGIGGAVGLGMHATEKVFNDNSGCK